MHIHIKINKYIKKDLFIQLPEYIQTNITRFQTQNYASIFTNQYIYKHIYLFIHGLSEIIEFSKLEAKIGGDMEIWPDCRFCDNKILETQEHLGECRGLVWERRNLKMDTKGGKINSFKRVERKLGWSSTCTAAAATTWSSTFARLSSNPVG